MGTMTVSKDGKTMFDIPDTDEEQKKAEAKGYKRYIDVTKDGKQIFTIPADDNVQKAFDKGYKTVNQWTASSNPSTATKVKQDIDDTIRGVSQGVTLGFGDEILGAAQSMVGPETYSQARDAKRQEYSEAEQRSPIAYRAGQTAGALVGGAQLPAKLIPTLTAGAAQGIGESNADLGVETLKDAGIGAAGAGAGFGLGKGLGATAKGVKSLLTSKPAETVATVAGEIVGEVPTEIGKKIIKNPALAAEGKGLTALSEDVVTSLNTLKTKLSADTDAAWETLKTTNAPFNPSQFQGLAAQVAKSRGISGSSQSAQKGAAKALMDAEKDLRMAKNWEELKGAIKQIDDNIDWNTPGKDTTNNALRSLRTEVDGILKQANPEYAQAMLPVAEKTAQLEQVTKALKLDRRGEATDNTLSALKALTRDFSKDSKPILKETLGNVDNQLLQNLEIEGMSQAMGRDVGRGARSAVTGGAAGAAIGAGVGGPVGAVVGGGIGAIAGFTRDKYGRQVAANALKWGSAPIQNMDAILGRIGDSWETLSPTAREAIANASVRGPAAMLSTWAVMKDK